MLAVDEIGRALVGELYWSTSTVSGGSPRVGERVALSVLMDDAGESGLHCPSSLALEVLLRLSSDSTAVDVRWSSFPVSCKFKFSCTHISVNTKIIQRSISSYRHIHIHS